MQAIQEGFAGEARNMRESENRGLGTRKIFEFGILGFGVNMGELQEFAHLTKIPSSKLLWVTGVKNGLIKLDA
ncbi:hypothetical protein L596_012280 [Steinernema carpocapsae]|uniref:Uncharacterized protein n=1 Tax=Steinernema carpocapsae TaxID=34508 RepID=A0A4U5NWK5_STECR|nr:hypothetical protein L596_012280 [Steinernema carpocapsae]